MEDYLEFLEYAGEINDLLCVINIYLRNETFSAVPSHLARLMVLRLVSV